MRGYPYRTLANRPYNLPIGGRSLLEASLEARIKVTDTIGVVPFFDAGTAFASRRRISMRRSANPWASACATTPVSPDPRGSRLPRSIPIRAGTCGRPSCISAWTGVLNGSSDRTHATPRHAEPRRRPVAWPRPGLPDSGAALAVTLTSAEEGDKSVLGGLLSRALSTPSSRWRSAPSTAPCPPTPPSGRGDQRPRRRLAETRPGPHRLAPARPSVGTPGGRQPRDRASRRAAATDPRSTAARSEARWPAAPGPARQGRDQGFKLAELTLARRWPAAARLSARAGRSSAPPAKGSTSRPGPAPRRAGPLPAVAAVRAERRAARAEGEPRGAGGRPALEGGQPARHAANRLRTRWNRDVGRLGAKLDFTAGPTSVPRAVRRSPGSGPSGASPWISRPGSRA